VKRLKLRVSREERAWKIELRLNRRAVSWLWVQDRVWRIGSAEVRIGGIGGVGTRHGHRHKGYSRLCMNKSLELMKEKGMEMSALFGISDFYPKWGFASAMAEPDIRISTRAAEESKPRRGHGIAAFDEGRHGKQVLEIYAASNADRSGSIVRPPFSKWHPFRMGSDWGRRPEIFVIKGGKGLVLGYCVHDKSETDMTVAEVGFRDPAVFPTLTAELARRAVVRRTGEITAIMPLDHPYAEYLRRWNAHYKAWYSKNGSAMARIILLEETLRKCAPVFSRRLLDSQFHAGRFSLGLATDIGDVTIHSDYAKVTIETGLHGQMKARVPQSVLAQLLLGYRSVTDAATAEGVGIPAPAVGFLSALFPTGSPFMWRPDRF